MKKKYYVILLIILLFIPAFSSPINTEQNDSKSNDIKVLTNDEPPLKPFIYGAGNNPTTIDPIDCWDTPTRDLIDQVCEGLFAYNLSDPILPLIPMLAEDFGVWHTITELSVKIR